MRAMREAAVVFIFEVADRHLPKGKKKGTKVLDRIVGKLAEVYIILAGKLIYGFWTRFLVQCHVTKPSQSETVFSHPIMSRHTICEWLDCVA
jgi:hypothetical protein